MAELTLDKTMQPDVLAKILKLSRHRQVVEYLCGGYEVSERRATCFSRMLKKEPYKLHRRKRPT